jgi:ribose transport system permease protein
MKPRKVFLNSYVIALALAVLIFLIGRWQVEGFGSLFSIRAMLLLTSLLAVAAVGQTLTMLLGGIDLSIPFVIGFANVVAAQLYGNGIPFEQVVLIVLGMAIVIGTLNGALSASLGIHPLIVTLGVGTIVQNAVLEWTKGFPGGRVPQFINEFVSIGGTLGPWDVFGVSVGPLPFPGVVPAVLIGTVVIVLLLERTVYGRQLYAIGANPVAARLALVRPVFIWSVTYALSAVFAAISGILLLGFTGSAFARVGQPYLFQTIAAVVIGGTSLLGGRGSFLGTLIGAFVLIELNTVLIGLGLSQSLVQAALGIVIVILVAIYGREASIRTRI